MELLKISLLKKEIDYWRSRCELAEDYIDKVPCDPDIYEDQRKAYELWQDYIKELPNTNHIYDEL